MKSVRQIVSILAARWRTWLIIVAFLLLVLAIHDWSVDRAIDHLQHNVYDLTMLTVALVTIHAAGRYAIRQQNYIIGSWVVPLTFLAAHYALLSFDIEPYNSDLLMQASVVRPSLFFLLVFISVFLFNGRVNRTLSRVLQGMSRAWAFRFKK
ncbi:MAG: hypothetical protein WCF84_26305 [Anaerolineae bacterium]